MFKKPKKVKIVKNTFGKSLKITFLPKKLFFT